MSQAKWVRMKTLKIGRKLLGGVKGHKVSSLGGISRVKVYGGRGWSDGMFTASATFDLPSGDKVEGLCEVHLREAVLKGDEQSKNIE